MCRGDRPYTKQELSVVDSPGSEVGAVRHDLLRKPVFDDIHGQRIGRRRYSRYKDVRHIAYLLCYDVPDLLRRDANAGIDDSHGMVCDLVGDGTSLDRRQG